MALSWVGASAALLLRPGSRILQCACLGLAVLGLLSGLALAGPQRGAESLRVAAFMPEGALSPDVPVGATAREGPADSGGAVAPAPSDRAPVGRDRFVGVAAATRHGHHHGTAPRHSLTPGGRPAGISAAPGAASALSPSFLVQALSPAHLGMAKEQAARSLLSRGKTARSGRSISMAALDASDPTFSERLGTAKLARQAATEGGAVLEAASATGPAPITEGRLVQLSAAIREVPEKRRAGVTQSLHAVLRRAGRGRTTRRFGCGGRSPCWRKPPPRKGRFPTSGVVPSFVREWRPRRDSNPRPQD